MEYIKQWLATHPLLVFPILLFGPPVVGFILTREKKERQVDRPWTEAETIQLLDSLIAGVPMETTAVRLRRTLAELVRQIEALGLFRRSK